MFTDCPGCNRQFRVRAQQLAAAQGLVQCGFCGEQFNALERLRDKPLTEQQAKAVPVLTENETLEPHFDIPDDIHKMENDDIKENDSDIEEVENNIPVSQDNAEELQDIGDFDTEIPPALLEEETVKPGWFSRLAWITGVLVLFIVAVGQLGWFNRDELLRRYPQLTPWAQRVCEYFQCELIRQRDLSAIKLINRDVREHPRFEDALLVNATIQNISGRTQPYPRVQLALFDTNGKLVAHREFAPKEYLDETIDIKQGMHSQQPVHIVLEVTGPTEGAVSFEFRFL